MITTETISLHTGVTDPMIVNRIWDDFREFMQINGHVYNQCEMIAWVNFWYPGMESAYLPSIPYEGA